MNNVVTTCLSVFKKYPTIFDGFDIDLEYPCLSTDTKCGPGNAYYLPSSDDKTAYTLFIKTLKAQLGSAPLSLMLSADINKLNAIDFVTIDPLIDHYNIKNYDLTAGNFNDIYTGFHSFIGPVLSDPLAARQSAGGYKANNYIAIKGISAKKVNMGSPMFGRGFQVAAGTIDRTNGFMSSMGGLKTGKYEDNIYDYKIIKGQYLTSTNNFYNANAQASYIYEPSTGMFISYESAKSAVDKVNFVKRNGLQGVFAWEFAGDSCDFELLNALNQNPLF